MPRSPTGYALPPSLKCRLKELSRTDWRVPALIALTDHLLVIVLAVCGHAVWASFTSPLAVLVTAVIYVGQARCLRGLENLVHDGSHYNWVRSRRWLNDLLTNLLTAWPVFASVGQYRIGHLRHHVEFGRSADPDFVRYQQLDVNGLDRSSLPRFARGLGRRLAAYIRGWWQAVGTRPWVLLSGLSWHAAVLVTASSIFDPAEVAWTWLVFWVLPFLAVLPVLRFVAETGKHDYGQPTVFDATISNLGLIHRLVFHPHGDGHHLLHHLFAAVPQYRLPQLHRLLVQTDLGRYRESRTRTCVLQEPRQR
jgi:fatty acid desaturase